MMSVHAPLSAQHRHASPADAAGVALSLACGIHCLLTPVLLLVLPALGEAFHRPIVHQLIAVGVTGIGAFALWRGYRRHRRLAPLSLGTLGILVIWSALLLPHTTHDHEHFRMPAGTIVTMIGSVLLIAGHLLNIRKCRLACCGGPS